MSKKAFFIKSTIELYEGTRCDKCELVISKVQDGLSYWNPNRKARHRNICQNCHDVIVHDRKETAKLWRQKHDEIENATDRRDVLLRAAFDLLTKCDRSELVLDVSTTTVSYDDTDCDGMCLLGDIATQLDIYGDADPLGT
tara:strand:- start:829 stop:1251 length:423 start_codon:yes stop_codon:yes gene_type:complete